MSIWAKKWAYEQHPKRLDDEGNVTDKRHPAAKAVLVALAEYPGPGQRDCWPSQKTLAIMVDMTDRQVRRCLADLEAQGLIQRTQRRRTDGTRRSDRITLLGPIKAFGPLQDVDEDQPDESAGRQDYQPDERAHQPDESSGHEPPTETSGSSVEESSNESSSTGEPQKAASPPPEGKEEEPEKPGAYANRVTAELIADKERRGVRLHPQTGEEKQKLGSQFVAEFKSRDSTVELDTALEFRVAKAAGEIEGEYASWCSLRYALDRVAEGWRPKLKALRELSPEEARPHDAEYAEMVAAWVEEARGERAAS